MLRAEANARTVVAVLRSNVEPLELRRSRSRRKQIKDKGPRVPPRSQEARATELESREKTAMRSKANQKTKKKFKKFEEMQQEAVNLFHRKEQQNPGKCYAAHRHACSGSWCTESYL